MSERYSHLNIICRLDNSYHEPNIIAIYLHFITKERRTTPITSYLPSPILTLHHPTPPVPPPTYSQHKCRLHPLLWYPLSLRYSLSGVNSSSVAHFVDLRNPFLLGYVVHWVRSPYSTLSTVWSLVLFFYINVSTFLYVYLSV